MLSCCRGAFFFLFFFSSRRRHTRWPRDWSSDVCSSDLYRFDAEGDLVSARDPEGHAEHYAYRHHVITERALKSGYRRSEERRVGKECRSRWERGRLKKKNIRKRKDTRMHENTQM